MDSSRGRTLWGQTLLLIVVFLHITDGLRVYEGTNFEAPKPKLKGLSKKSTYISKRSWVPDESLKLAPKADGRSEGKWKDAYNRKSVHNHFPSLYKIIFKGKGFKEYVKYTKEIPRLEEYTFCMWYKPNQITQDHTLFSYALNRNEKLLRFWFNAADSTLRMAIRESPAFKVPANIRKGKWHHICQSWHGVLGEWQVFLDGKRIGVGMLPLYKETYIPEGGEVILSREPTADKQMDLNGPLDGEVYGFNLVDEAVPGEQATFINSQYKPNVRAAPVPPFKKLPPMKKTYQEIKAYISKLPSHPAELENPNGIDMKAYPDERTGIKRTRASVSHMKRQKINPKTRRPPMRKVVIYSRHDRKLPLEHSSRDTNPKVKPEEIKNNTATVSGQPFDETYSIHSYRMGKNVKKSSNYEIYESQEEDVPMLLSQTENSATRQKAVERKARENFDLYTARQANKVYTLSNSVRDARKHKFHFETGLGEATQQSGRSSDNVKNSQAPQAVKVVQANRRISESIPVYENEGPLSRQKRQVKRGVEDQLADGFRRLPQIPDSLIGVLTKNASKTEIEQTLNHFFPQNITNESLELAASGLVEESTAAPPNVHPTEIIEEPEVDEPNPVPVAYQVPQVDQTVLAETMPVNFPEPPKQIMDIDPRKRIQDKSSSDWYTSPNAMVDRRKFDVTSGTDLIMRSYGLCTSDRGSPIQHKRHLVISWAETPIRIFGGAEIETARNECGNF
ncbi:hypothetical protein RUM44_001691 [Polyplax serrata]|uniref:Pentraxin (PTX) domain-containing protein n=1 Tax=Polyplax serrata TaxID=468196 RepID=A0ABR1AKR2_POLSC